MYCNCIILYAITLIQLNNTMTLDIQNQKQKIVLHFNLLFIVKKI